MPELPEVETIRLQLQKFIVGHKITDIEIRWQKIFTGEKEKVIGSKILGVRRFGKVLVVDLDNQYSLVIQIKLTGQLIYRNKRKVIGNKLSPKVLGGLGGKHTHVIFKLDRGGVLYYNDVRKFGRIRTVKTKEIEKEGLIGKLGPEPFDSFDNTQDKFAQGKLPRLTLDIFSEILAKSKRPIKILLMDQEKISGIGNIYANDALYLAKVSPRRSAVSLNRSEAGKLFNSIEEVLREGIKRGGASELSFVTPDGGEGNYQDFTLVYGREGEKCKRCGSEIKKIKLGGRGTYFCPKCQH